MDETTTEQATQEAGANALPENQVDNSADISQNHAQGDTTDSGANALPENADEKLVKFAESHGITLDSESAIKAAKIAMDNQSAYQQAQSKASQLNKTLAPQNQLDDGMQEFIEDYKRDKMISQFKESTSDWQEHEPRMVEILGQQSQSGYTYNQLVNAGLLSLHDVYAMAKATKPQENTREVLQKIANTQLAGGISQGAVNSAPKSDKPDPILEAIKRSRES